jgi:antitoxin component YwqK of YwqJK toxin-antitoxin module
LQSEGKYINGEAEGLVKSYYISGQLRTEGIYSDGKPKEGIVRHYFENGQMRFQEGAYAYGINNGIE